MVLVLLLDSGLENTDIEEFCAKWGDRKELRSSDVSAIFFNIIAV